ncbi:MAG: baseplate wedge tail fiber connector [Enterobacter phage ENC7]|nr:MAG: baseplate wedge tail fiber connector [Enterobacter phage ENC7]UIW11739.1 MAG: baseplate wedge tail fiber connector [Enterobacter phage ENC25]UIW11997.1 MAG: baseplate wedge tail fiber connector [Enterobacter phage ENC22]UJB55329.1 baseplate wedge tail fiber connector [Enterobacter phage vB_EcRAM-01]
MAYQTGKKLIDVGQIGNPSTGDPLYDGGVKLNEMVTNIYNAFGDVRLLSANNGVGTMLLHATGYYQKLPRTYYSGNPIELGSLHDMDTSTGPITVVLPTGKLGEGCYFINSNGSVSVDRPIVFRPQVGDGITGVQDQLYVTSPYTRIMLWCTKKEGSVTTWDYSVESMFGSKTMPVDATKLILKASSTAIPLFGYSEFSGAKLLVYAENMTGTVTKMAEILLGVDRVARNVYSTEYAVLKNSDDDMYTLNFTVGAGDVVYANVQSKLEDRIKFTIKAIDTIKSGIAA